MAEPTTKVNLSLPVTTVEKLDALCKDGWRKRTTELTRLIEEEYKRRFAAPQKG